MTNEELVQMIQEGVNVQENMGILYQQNEGIIRKVVKPLSKYAETEDLMQEAYFGLMGAVDNFNPSMGTKFTTYLPFRIRQHCIRHIQNFGNTKRIPVYMINKIRKYERLMSEFHGDLDEETIMQELELNESQFSEMLVLKNTMDCVSIDKPIQTAEDNLTIGDTIEADEDIEGTVLDAVMYEELWNQVNKLNEKLKYVILKHFREEEDTQQIAEHIGVSRQRVYQLEQKALAKLKKVQKVQQIAMEFDYNCSLAYSSGRSAFDNGKGSTVERLVMKKLDIEERLQKRFSVLDDTMSVLAVNSQAYTIDRITDLCELNDISVKTMEKEAGLGSGSVTKWKNGYKPRKTSLQKIADYFEVPLTYLTGETA